MYDVLIIGSGPAGLSAAIYSKRANLKVAVLEKEYAGTGQIAESEKVDNYPGFPEISGYDLGEKFREHALRLEVPFIEHEAVKIEKNQDKIWEVSLENKEKLYAKTIIYATGASPRKLDVKGEEQLLGKGISFCAVCDGAFYKDKTVAVIGGGNTAVDDALLLSDIAQKVYLIHRRDEFRASKKTVELVKQKENVEIILNASVKEVEGEKLVTGIVLEDGRKIEVSGIFEAIGQAPSTKLISTLTSLDESGYVVAGEDGKTDNEGLFVAGDVRTKKLRQVVTAVSDGANAVSSVEEYLYS